MDRGKTILLIDRDQRSAGDIKRFLEADAFRFKVSASWVISDLLLLLETRSPDLVLLDIDYAGMPGYETLKRTLKKLRVPVVLLGDADRSETILGTKSSGAADFICKDKTDLVQLQKTIVSALNLSEIEAGPHEAESGGDREALLHVLDGTSEGIVVLDRLNKIIFANRRAYAVLSDPALAGFVSDHFKYRKNPGEQYTYDTHSGIRLHLRIEPVVWQQMPASIFYVTRTESPQHEKLPGKSELIAFADAVSEPVLILQRGRVLLANSTALQLLGEKARSAGLIALSDLLETDEPLEEVPRDIQYFFAERIVNARLSTEDGGIRAVNLHLRPLRLGENFCQFVTLRLKDRLHEGRASGAADQVPQELSTENVLHLASHDLREPIRTILNYLQLTSDKLGENNVDEAREYAGYAQTAASRMERLLTDMKTYIGLNSHVFSPAQFSMKQVLNEVMRNAKPVLETMDAQVSVAELPEIKADRELVLKLCAQLLGNALKFIPKGTAPIVDISFENRDGRAVFCFRDNGIGIPKKYHQKVFDLFERLHRLDEYSGNGLGLALCKKIVGLHGGQIWVESLPGMGSSFFFTLQPKD